VVSFVPVAWSWQEGWDLYALFKVRGARPIPKDIVLVPIDRRAARRLYLPMAAEDFERCRDVRLDERPAAYKNPVGPHLLARWPRCLHARALDALARAQPEAIVMDISFLLRSDPSGRLYAEQDRVLAESIRRARSVLLALKIGGIRAADDAQPIADEIEAAALAVAPFLVLGHQLERADKFCTFKEGNGWSGPCLPTVAHLAVSLKAYPKFRELLARTASDKTDLVRASIDDLLRADVDELLADGALQVPARLMRLLATSPQTAERLRMELALEEARNAPDFPLLRSLAEIYLGPAIRYFNFYGEPGQVFQPLRYETLVAGEHNERPPVGSLRGKVVFIGFAEYEHPESAEHFTTPFTKNNIRLSGVELAATAYANLRDGSAIKPIDFWLRGMIALALGIVFTLLGIAFVPRGLAPGTAVLGICAVAYFVVALITFKLFALWLPVSPLGLDVIGGFAAGFVETKRQKARLYEALLKFVPKQVADRIVNENPRLGQIRESVFATCVITDMQRFTALFKNRRPNEVAELLDRYFEALFPVIQREGGYTVDVLGDSMLALWHDKIPHPGLREQACIAALQLAEAAEHFREPRSDETFPTRIGVDYGEITIGMVGSTVHLKYGPVGVPVNAASRLQELCKRLNTRLLVTGSVIAGLQRFLLRDLGRFKLRDVPGVVDVYELMGELSSATPEQIELCEKFSLALATYQNGQPGEARERFEALLGQYENDGPSSFYGSLCMTGQYFGKAPIPQDESTARR
jgi:adenylate cyclase